MSERPDGGGKGPSHRLRFGAGLLVGTILVAAAGHRLLTTSLGETARFGEDRRAVISLRALTDVVARAGSGEAVRTVVAGFAKWHPQVAATRVVLFDGISLEASTDPADTGENAPPRRLKREEKDLYDRGQRLRAAIETNLQEGGGRKDEVEKERLPDGSVSLAAPVEKDGEVVGLVETRRVPPPPAPRPSLLTTLSYVVVPVLLFALLTLVIGERRVPLGILAALLLAGTAWGYGAQSWAKLSRARTALEASVAEQVKTSAARGQELLGALPATAAPLAEAPPPGTAPEAAPATPPAPLDPASWDSDAFRRPLGLSDGAGRVDEAKVASALGAAKAAVTRTTLLLGALALVLVGFIGLGGLAALLGTLKTHRVAYSYVLPAMFGMILLVFFPFVYGIILSFTDQTIYNSSAPLTEIWVGFQNYVSILTDFKVARTAADGGIIFNYQNFYWTLWITIAWTVTNVTYGVVVGLILALVLNTKGLALKPAYRVLLILPWAMPNYITALIWQGMFHQQFGVVNQVVQMFGMDPVSWFEKPATSFFTAWATNGWLSFPFMMVISLGALQSIPSDLYEAARVDGATRWQQFRSITLPSLKPALVPAVILSVVWTFNMFNIIFLVTAGEPAGSTEILITQSYKFAFQKYQYGYAAAYSTVIFGILLIYGVFQNRMTKGTEAI
ncbi:MAG TPA: sugar ABC transporter permease [Thermoanaerobaculia bacterium]|nr:sugar ABC transporter permease [Thermoanaerobaculia bacterium]